MNETLGKEKRAHFGCVKGTMDGSKRIQGLSIPAPTLKTLVEDANTSSNPKRHLIPLLGLIFSNDGVECSHYLSGICSTAETLPTCKAQKDTIISYFSEMLDY
ncbi:hypothetical protein VNO77_43663 [Canavalia gladiata]|uniref:Uncharacterized protein n=1 Tax=Canavalia gladiata TaxID=3824 RepID=A0AAN9JV77_CANGL